MMRCASSIPNNIPKIVSTTSGILLIFMILLTKISAQNDVRMNPRMERNQGRPGEHHSKNSLRDL